MAIATEGGHWYKDGKPFYTIIGANGKERDVTLRDARKLDLDVAVSTITKCEAKGALDNWNVDRHLRCLLSLPKDSWGDDVIRRVKKQMKDESEAIMGLGSTIHTCIEKHLKGETLDLEYAPHVKAAIKSLSDWCGPGPYGVEKSFSHSLRFGGKVDVHKAGFVADYKTKEFDESELPDTWPNHWMQLAAYRMGLKMDKARCAIIFVSTSVPGLTHLVEVGADELDRGWEMFKGLLHYWKHKNQYLT